MLKYKKLVMSVGSYGKMLVDKAINITQTNAIGVSTDEYQRLKREMKDLRAEQKSVQRAKQAKKEVHTHIKNTLDLLHSVQVYPSP